MSENYLLEAVVKIGSVQWANDMFERGVYNKLSSFFKSDSCLDLLYNYYNSKDSSIQEIVTKMIIEYSKKILTEITNRAKLNVRCTINKVATFSKEYSNAIIVSILKGVDAETGAAKINPERLKVLKNLRVCTFQNDELREILPPYKLITQDPNYIYQKWKTDVPLITFEPINDDPIEYMLKFVPDQHPYLLAVGKKPPTSSVSV